MKTEVWTPAQYREYVAKQAKKKTRARKTVCRVLRHHHPSGQEADYCDWLSARLQNGEIKSFKWQHSLKIKFRRRLWKTWKVDFIVYELDKTISYHECKGYNLSDESYKLRRDAFLLANPTARLYVNKQLWTGRARKESVSWRIADVRRLTDKRRERPKNQA